MPQSLECEDPTDRARQSQALLDDLCSERAKGAAALALAVDIPETDSCLLAL